MTKRAYVFVLLLTFCTVSSASLSDEMGGMLNDMSNYTSPGTYKTQRRGVIAGGSYVGRNRIVNENIVSAVPPSFDAGCGGIDLFGGSFSFISADRLLNLMRSIASNAKGYAFEIALKEMCPTCMQTRETLQKKLQKLNQMSVNSCEAAQGIVTDTAAAVQGKLTKDNSMVAQTFGGFGDTFQSMWDSDPSKASHDSAPDKTREEITGNLVWRAMRRSSVSNWFTYGDSNLLEQVMSMTGTIIVKPAKQAPDNKGESNPTQHIAPTLGFHELVAGGHQTPVLKCTDGHDADECLEIQVKQVEIKGFDDRITDVLIGSPSSAPGLIHKMATLSGSITNAEKCFIVALPSDYGTLIRKLSALNEGAAIMFVRETSTFIALDMARDLLMQSTSAVRASASLGDHAYSKQLQDLIEQSRSDLRDEWTAEEKKHNKTGLIAKYNNILQQVRARTYMARGMQKTVSASK